MIGQVVSHYKILEKLGEGGMGEVYLAEDMSLGRKVAIKFLSADKAADSEARKRFIHEARAQALVTHTNVTAFHEVGEEQDKVFIVMEYIEGQKLSEFAKTEKLSLSEILDLAIQVGEGLSAAHEKGVMHRDINPNNILVTSKGTAKITDFGLAKWKGASTITKTGLQMGTDSYMSPEQLEGRKADFRTDIFSFGVVLYELICARRPFEGNNRETLFYEILYTQPQPLARYSNKTSENLQRIVSKCLAKKPEERYQSVADLVADLKKEKKSIESGKPFLPKPKKWLPILVPAGIGLALLVFLIFKPFQIKIGSGGEAAAEQNSMAVMYFENIPDPEDKDHTGEMLTNLLITSLSQLKGWEVISRQRLYDIQADMGKPDEKKITPSLASKIAQRAGVQTMLLGTVLQSQPNLAVTSQLIEVKSGKILSSQRLTGYSADQIFPFVDSLAVLVRGNLNIPASAASEAKPVAEVTTHSPEAYRYYLEGVNYLNKYYFTEALNSFNKALSYDSTFAMAYARSAGLAGAEGGTRLALALKYSAKATRMEQYYIKAGAANFAKNYVEAEKYLNSIIEQHPQEKDAYLELGFVYELMHKHKEAIPQYIKTIEIDPLCKPAYNGLGYAYDQVGDLEKSIKALDKYIELAPEEFNAYDTKGDVYVHNGKLDWAIESYRRALEKKPDSYLSVSKLGHIYLLKHDYVKAEQYYKELIACSDKDYRSEGRLFSAYVPLYQGKFAEALTILEHGVTEDEMEQVGTWPRAFKYLAKASIFEQQKEFKMAVGEAKKSLGDFHGGVYSDFEYYRDFYIIHLAESGDISKAEEMAILLKRDLEKSSTTQMPRYWSIRGNIELAKKNPQTALTYLKNVPQEFPAFYSHFALAKAYLESNRLGEAVAEFEKLPSILLSPVNFNQLMLMPSVVKSDYFLGLAYEESGWNNRAIEKYQEFLDIWKNADPGIAEVEDAKQRLANLKKKT